MVLNVNTIPFSCFGSHLTVSYYSPENFFNKDSGIYIRNISNFSPREIFRIELCDPVSNKDVQLLPEKMTISESLEISFYDKKTLFLKSSESFSLNSVNEKFDSYNLLILKNDVCQYNFNGSKYIVTIIKGKLEIADQSINVTPENELIEVLIKYARSSWKEKKIETSFESCAELRKKEFDRWLEKAFCS